MAILRMARHKIEAYARAIFIVIPYEPPADGFIGHLMTGGGIAIASTTVIGGAPASEAQLSITPGQSILAELLNN